MSARKRFFIMLGVLLATYWIGVVGYMVLDRDLTLLDAIYMVTITLSTVGYREVTKQTPATEAWTIVLIMFGTLTVAATVATLASTLLEAEIGRFFGRKSVQDKIDRMSEHTIVCGFGRMGKLLVDQLQERGLPVAIIERSEERLADVESPRYTILVGDATEEDMLERAGIDRARNLVATLADDADNVFATLTARQLNADLYIVARSEDASTEPKLRRAGANRVISPQIIGADWIANVLTRPNVVDFVDVAAKGVELEMAEVEVPADSPLMGMSLREADLRRFSDIIVVAIRRPDGTTRFNPGADESLNAGDLLITIGEAGAANKLSNLRELKAIDAKRDGR